MIHWLTESAVTHTTKIGRTLTDKIDKVVLNRVLGLPIFLLMMYLTFMFTINVGGAFIDFFDIAIGAIFVDGMAEILGHINAPAWLIGILATGIGGGIQTVATFIPPIGFMFLALAFLEGSGYMARAAFVMDRFMRAIGLPGKAFVPLIVGFGCNVPAIMATRVIPNRRDRIATILAAPFMTCSARLPVYALLIAAFVPDRAVGWFNLHGIVLIPRITKVNLRETPSGKQLLTEIWLTYTLVNAEDPDDAIEIPWYGQGADMGEKGIGKALTYAEKYLILKLLQIPTDEDDPDAGGAPRNRPDVGARGWELVPRDLRVEEDAAAIMAGELRVDGRDGSPPDGQSGSCRCA